MRLSVRGLLLVTDLDADAMTRLVDGFHAMAKVVRANRATVLAAAVHLLTETAPGEKTGLIDLLRYVAGRQHDRRETKEGRT
jgi:hypothetical protein